MGFLKIIFLALLIFISPIILAQQMITGCITDASDGMSVPGASVFIANTTIGTATDASGNYSFTVPGRGSFEIVISHIGYQSVFHKIDTPLDAHRFDVALEINELEEVTIRAAKTYRQSDIDLFWRTILGEKPTKNGIQVLNPEKVYFYKSNNVLKVSCREPIEIINHQMGYSVRYMLQSFEYDYRTKEYILKGSPYFEELTPQNSRQKERWEKKRQDVYAVSINHFLRALYREQIHEEGYLLVNRDDLLNREKTSPALLKDIMQTGRDAALVTIVNPLLLICYAMPIANPMNIDSNRDIKIKGALYPIMELSPQQIIIYPDGTYRGTLKMIAYQNSIFGLSSELPIEYAAVFSSLGQTTKPVAIEIDDVNEADLYFLIAQNMAAQLEKYPQEKIHLHTDRDLYAPGEKIWFKAYVVDAYSHLFPASSEYVYVELISPVDTLVNRVMIAQADNMFYGHLPLPDNIQEGYYTLCAYTRYMENPGDDYFFKKNIRIGSPSPTLPNWEGDRDIAERHAEQNLNSPLSVVLEGAFDISFFPEGGNLPEGVFSKVALKALNEHGYPETISGTLIDHTGAEIASIQTYHAGMGVFTYLPDASKKYFLKCRNENGLEKQFELPQPNIRAYSLSTSIQNDRIIVGLRKSDRSPDIPYFLLVHCRGEVLYFSEWDGKQDVKLLTKDLSVGVIQLLLLDSRMNTLSERLVFNSNDTSEQIDFLTEKDAYQVRDKIVATLSLPDSYSLPFGEGSGGAEGLAHFSIAVTDDKDFAIDESTTILSSLLLSSELKGTIEHPAYYLQDEVAMDLLMMTHGWRRYNIPEVVQGQLDYPVVTPQLFQEVTGQVKTLTSNRPVPDSEVFIMMQGEGGGFGVTQTDANGSFTVQDLLFPESTVFYIQALDKNGRDNVKIEMKAESFPVLTYALQRPLLRQKIKDESDENTFLTKAQQRAKFEEDIWTLYLNEVEITAPKIERRKDEPRLQQWYNGRSDLTITKEEIERQNHLLVSDYLKSVPGITVYANGIIHIRGGINSFSTPVLPLILVDGIRFPWPDDIRELQGNKFASPLEQIPIHDIESIDVFKGGSAAVFGMSGANGVISITTKRGDFPVPTTNEAHNTLVYRPAGYQIPVEFYAPKYETLEVRQSPIPDYRTTIFWKPDVVITDDGEASFEFYASDFPTTYSVVIEGLTTTGTIVRQVEKIQVK